MAFFDDTALKGLRIEKMVFHLVGAKDEDFELLEAIDPSEHSAFFIDRLKSVNYGAHYAFEETSETLSSLKRVLEDATLFQAESETLAERFKALHKGNTKRGALILFLLVLGDGSTAFAMLKTDDETVLAYDVKKGEGGRKRVSLKALETTFVKNREALQKTALIRISNGSAELCVLDYKNQQNVARYFEIFLGATRAFSDEELTEKLVKATRSFLESNLDKLPDEVARNITKRTFEAAVAGGKIDGGAQQTYLDTVMGRKLPDKDPLAVAYAEMLRTSKLLGVPIQLDAGKVKRAEVTRVVTASDIELKIPSDVMDLVEFEDDYIIIRDQVRRRVDATR